MSQGWTVVSKRGIRYKDPNKISDDEDDGELPLLPQTVPASVVYQKPKPQTKTVHAIHGSSTRGTSDIDIEDAEAEPSSLKSRSALHSRADDQVSFSEQLPPQRTESSTWRSPRPITITTVRREHDVTPVRIDLHPLGRWWNGFDSDGYEIWYIELSDRSIITNKHSTYQHYIRKYYSDVTSM